MKRLITIFLVLCGACLTQACHNSTQNTDKPVPSQAKDTSTAWRDTSPVGRRADR